MTHGLWRLAGFKRDKKICISFTSISQKTNLFPRFLNPDERTNKPNSESLPLELISKSDPGAPDRAMSNTKYI